MQLLLFTLALLGAVGLSCQSSPSDHHFDRAKEEFLKDATSKRPPLPYEDSEEGWIYKRAARSAIEKRDTGDKQTTPDYWEDGRDNTRAKTPAVKQGYLKRDVRGPIEAPKPLDDGPANGSKLSIESTNVKSDNNNHVHSSSNSNVVISHSNHTKIIYGGNQPAPAPGGQTNTHISHTHSGNDTSNNGPVVNSQSNTNVHTSSAGNQTESGDGNVRIHSSNVVRHVQSGNGTAPESGDGVSIRQTNTNVHTTYSSSGNQTGPVQSNTHSESGNSVVISQTNTDVHTSSAGNQTNSESSNVNTHTSVVHTSHVVHFVNGTEPESRVKCPTTTPTRGTTRAPREKRGGDKEAPTTGKPIGK